MTGNKTRKKFLDYFSKQDHRIIKSSSLVPANDPSLLFTNAGMNQFKDVFLGKEKRNYVRATTSQKCVRAGGKHNDFENVGKTARHHTFFEMLGNFSFGDYFKIEAIALAWELVTQEFGLDPKKLWITVYKDDDESFNIWNQKIGIPTNRIFRLGEKDNFWTMGSTGPCGPCSELHFDQGPSGSESKHQDCVFPCDCGRYVEIWNLVFMEFDRQDSGELVPLPKPSVDTGMGLERMTAVLQGKTSNYETDLLRPLVDYAAEIAKKAYGDEASTDVSLRVIADHARAATFLISDGVIPSNEGRGYVLRKILRRGIRHGRLLGIETNFLQQTTGKVMELMKEPYPEMISFQQYVDKVVANEENRFRSTLRIALDQFNAALTAVLPSNARKLVLPGKIMFKFYDTYGLPLDLMQEIADEKQIELDETTFNKHLEQQRNRGRTSWIQSTEETALSTKRDFPFNKTNFLGYKNLEVKTAQIIGINLQSKNVSTLTEGQEGEIFLDKSPFYTQKGGQIGDTGVLKGTNFEAVVTDTYDVGPSYSAHLTKCIRGSMELNDEVHATVDLIRHNSINRNHTATHLLHSALRQILGFHVKQSGSLVAEDRLRFDFSHYAPLETESIVEIENLVYEKVLQNFPVTTLVKNLDEAISEGAMALFGEKYGNQVRVVSIDSFSRELCGGTHVKNTGEIGLFKIISESGIASGIRRIEALTGKAAFDRFRGDEELINELQDLSRVGRGELIVSLEKFQSDIRSKDNTLKKIRYDLAKYHVKQIMESALNFKDVKVLTGVVNDLDKGSLRNLVDEVKCQINKGVVVLTSVVDGKISLVASITDNLTPKLHAGKMVKEIASMIDGNGGGRPTMAEAGGKDCSKISQAMEAVGIYVEKTIEKSN